MAEKKKIPEIRFKGFTEEWEEQKLGDFCLIGDIDHKMPKSVIDGIPYLMTGDFIGTNDLDFENSKHISTEDYEQLSKKIKPEAGDILFARYASVGAVRYVETQRKFLVSYSCAIIKNNDAANWKYIYYYLQANQVQRQIELGINTGSQRNIGIDSLKKLIILLPQEKEQDNVAIFLTNLDHLITLHQRKYNKLVTVKKAMLEKMFPQNGAVVPEIRFKGFTEAWEERKLGDVSDLLTGFPFQSKSFIEDGIPLVRGMNVKRGYLDMSEDICEYWPSSYGLESYLLIESDVVIQMDGALIGKSYAQIQIKNLPALLVQRVTRVRSEKVNCEFIYQCIQRNFLSHIQSIKTETAVPHLSLNDIRNFKITIPSANEQSKIGKYFKHLDNLINLQKCELEKLKNIKKGCLEKMFV